jgi:hypothetical protein
MSGAMRDRFAEFAYYPSDAEIDAWCASVWALANATDCRVELLQRDDFGPGAGVNHSHYENSYVRYSPRGMDDFYGYWQPAASAAAPLLVHVPGYGHEMSAHPELVAMGYHVLHISPLGYMTPTGPDESKRPDGEWPVLPETVTSGAEAGYRNWLANCIMAVRWAWSLPEVIADRVSFFGTSQGVARTGALDETCPPGTIQSLYDMLPGTKSMTHVADLGHRYSRGFIPLAAAWFRLYA